MSCLREVEHGVSTLRFPTLVPAQRAVYSAMCADTIPVDSLMTFVQEYIVQRWDDLLIGTATDEHNLPHSLLSTGRRYVATVVALHIPDALHYHRRTCKTAVLTERAIIHVEQTVEQALGF